MSNFFSKYEIMLSIHKDIINDMEKRKTTITSLEETMKVTDEQMHILEKLRSNSSSMPITEVLMYKSMTLHTKLIMS